VGKRVGFILPSAVGTMGHKMGANKPRGKDWRKWTGGGVFDTRHRGVKDERESIVDCIGGIKENNLTLYKVKYSRYLFLGGPSLQ
jgi:hypothetical protein